MRIIVNDAGISTGSLLKLITVGWVIGMGIFAIPIMLIMGIAAATWLYEGHGFNGMLLFVVVFPLALPLQGLMLGAIILFGLWVYRKFKPVEVRRPAV